MELLGLIGLAAYCGVSLVVGTRLLLLARRTREQPELLIGLAFLTGGAVGYGLVVASTLVVESSPERARVLFYAGMPLISLCAICLYRFWQKLYHPQPGWASAFVALATVLLAVGLGAQWSTSTAGDAYSTNPWYRLQLFVQAGAYAINFVANARFQATLRRRMVLRLADPIVVNRVFLWALASAAVCTQYLYTLILVLGAAPGERAEPHPGVISLLGLGAAAAMLLAFFPPRAYQRWLTARGEAGSAPASG